MKRILLLLLTLFSCSYTKQYDYQKMRLFAYDNISTAPSYLTIKILVDNKEREICIDSLTLYHYFFNPDKITQEDPLTKIKDLILQDKPFFEIKDDYEKNYDYKKVLYLNKKLGNSIRKTMKDYLKKRENYELEPVKYESLRNKLFLKYKNKHINGGINLKLIKFIENDPWSDTYNYDQYLNLIQTIHDVKFLNSWLLLINPYYNKYLKVTKDFENFKMKNIDEYYNKYGIYFCHFLFMNGIVSGRGCIIGDLEIRKVFN